jgi:HEAT repeat protein
MKKRVAAKIQSLAVVLWGGLAAFAFAAPKDNGINRKIQMLNSGNSSQRINAARELSQHGKNFEADRAMADQLSNEKDTSVRRTLYETIGGPGGRESAKVLRDKVKSEKGKGARQMAIHALGRTQDAGSVPTLRSLFLDEKENISARLQAGNALSYINAGESVRALEEGLKDKNPTIRLQAASALSSIDDSVLKEERIQALRRQAKEDTDLNNRQYIREYILKRKFKLKE